MGKELIELLREARKYVAEACCLGIDERQLLERIDAALAQPAAAAEVERDAARYRRLRTWVDRDVDTQTVVPMTGTFQATALSLDELDAAIDASMLAAAPERKK